MSAGRAAVVMTDEEIEQFLTDSMKVQVATIGPEGNPHLSTLFYVVHGGKIAFWTYGSSQKIRNLERDPRITCLVEGGDDYFESYDLDYAGGKSWSATSTASVRSERQSHAAWPAGWTSATWATRWSSVRSRSASAW